MRTQEQISVWRPADFGGVEVRSGVAVKEPYPRHWHEEYQFCFIQDGGGELIYRGMAHSTPANSLFIVHPGEVHSNQTETGCSFRSLYVEPVFIKQTTAGMTSYTEPLPFFRNPILIDLDVKQQYLALHRALEMNANALECETALLELLATLLARFAEGPHAFEVDGSEHVAVTRARDYIAECFEHNISLSELAALANLSPFHLHRVFTNQVGMSPHAFLVQVRVARSKKLIRSGMALSDVAQRVGFADQSHLNRHFKRLLKITPGQYRQTARSFNT